MGCRFRLIKYKTDAMTGIRMTITPITPPAIATTGFVLLCVEDDVSNKLEVDLVKEDEVEEE